MIQTGKQRFQSYNHVQILLLIVKLTTKCKTEQYLVNFTVSLDFFKLENIYTSCKKRKQNNVV